MLTVAWLRQLLPAHSWTCSIDLQDAYWHVPVAPHFRQFLGFRIGQTKYRFRVVPFGLSITPRVFTKLVNIILTSLRRQGINVVAYLDDWLVWGDSPEQCLLAVYHTHKELERRGFLLNLQKSRLTPQQEFDWLGLR